MKCPNCGEEVPQGYLFCPKCLEEIPWVPEFNTLETIENKREYTRKKRIQKVKKHVERHHLPRLRRKKIVIMMTFILLAAIMITGGGYMYYRNLTSYAYQYEQARKDLEQGRYEKALEHVERAISLDSSYSDAQVLLADILAADKDQEGARKVLEAAMITYPNDELIYSRLIALYIQEEQYDAVKKLLDDCQDTDIRKVLQDYITPDPVISEDTGSYDHELSVTITGQCSEYYYTINGKTPDTSSDRYTRALTIQEGTTELRVVGYNDNHIPSDVLYRKYIIEIQPPAAPVILPEETVFELDTSITIEVPEGYTCYYSFDNVPTTDSAVYAGPVPMPEGTHTICAFLVGASGTPGEMSSKTYELVY